MPYSLAIPLRYVLEVSSSKSSKFKYKEYSWTAVENEYMDRLELKSANDRTLGVGVVQGESEVIVLTVGTVMKVSVDMDAVGKFHPGYAHCPCIFYDQKY